MKASVVIPARWKSERLPGKMLADLGGKPLLWHTWSRVCRMKRAHEVIVAVDDRRVFEEVKRWGGEAVMTEERCESGTERIVSILGRLKGDMILNVQGDECFIDADLLDELVGKWHEGEPDIITPVYRIRKQEDLENPGNVKVVVADDGRALYFSRSPVPYCRGVERADWVSQHEFWWHLGIYGYRRDVLEGYEKLPKSRLEEVEKLEQWRYLEAGYKIVVFETDYHEMAVDTVEDLEKARGLMLKPKFKEEVRV